MSGGATAFHYGFAAGGWPFISAGFVVLLAAFIGHVIVNIVFETRFTASEVALGLVTYCVSVLGFGLAMLLSSSAERLYAVPVTLGLLGMASAIVVTMILWLGLRGAFSRSTSSGGSGRDLASCHCAGLVRSVRALHRRAIGEV